MCWYFCRRVADGTVDRVHDALRDAARDQAGRDSMASARAVGSPSVEGAATAPAASRGFDAGKEVNGRERHLVVDTTGLLIAVMVTAACVQNSERVKVLARRQMAMPSVAMVSADGGYCRRIQEAALRLAHLVVAMVAKLPGSAGSPSWPGGGWSSAPRRGSPGTAAWTGTTSAAPRTPKR